MVSMSFSKTGAASSRIALLQQEQCRKTHACTHTQQIYLLQGNMFSHQFDILNDSNVQNQNNDMSNFRYTFNFFVQ